MPLERRTVYCVPAARLAPGSSVITRVVALYRTAAVTSAPVAVVPWRRVAVVPLTPVTGSLNVAVGLTSRAWPVAPAAGVRVVTAGAVVSAAAAVVKDQLAEAAARALPAASRTPARRTVYCVLPARSAVGSSTIRRVAAS